MQSLRINIIITLILLVVVLHVMARTLRNVSAMVAQNGPVAAGKLPQGFSADQSNEMSLFSQLFGQAKHTFKPSRKPAAETKKNRLSLQDVSETLAPVSAGPKVLQIIHEEPPREVKNPALGARDCARLTNDLAKDRMENAQLTQEIAALFGPVAQKEAIALLTKNENDAYKAASTCPSLKKCLQQKKQLDQDKQAKLTELLKTHKNSFNYKAKSGSDSWNAFYQRLNSFRRAQD